ncbi:unnamed protein product [Wuchereria bancrofti]|uniref:DUF5641 domain-containing protein n=1 Tax=Wuchereria bancrofti TaxID=6293 RepID=A0A3P7FV81_WUCBA|nr:unnamed protein product [Wuchereria bancrofti]
MRDEYDDYVPGKLDSKQRLLQYWTSTLKVLDIFWELWKREYLTSLRERTQREHSHPKSTEEGKPKKGGIVLLDKPDTPRGLWKLAKRTEKREIWSRASCSNKDGKQTHKCLIPSRSGRNLLDERSTTRQYD